LLPSPQYRNRRLPDSKQETASLAAIQRPRTKSGTPLRLPALSSPTAMRRACDQSEARMPWFKRKYGTASYEREHQHFAKLFRDLAGPKGMMMVREDRPTECIVYIALSENLATRNFPEFEPAEMPPPDCTWLFGRDDDREAFRSRTATGRA
jgi:hypothetical protein